jgi:hypothetical protein
VTVQSDADLLRTATEDAAMLLRALVGDPPMMFGEDGLVTEFDPAKRAHVIVDREQVPEILWRGAIKALDVLSIALGLSELETRDLAP